MPDEMRDGELGELMRAALREESVAGGEKGALAAFREARDAGLHTSRPTRDRDDWTPAEERRRPRRSLKTAVAALVASVTLGGVAVATGDLPEPFLGTTAPTSEPSPATHSAPGTDPAPASASASAERGATAGATRTPPPGTTAPLRPEKDPPELPGRSREALCDAFEKTEGEAKGNGNGNGKAKTKAGAPPSTARQRLVAAAGGEEFVAEYCGHELRPARDPSAAPRPNDGTGRAGSWAGPGRGDAHARADRP
ncbi:hypothetical protein [Streptomyces nymphaeiformis]|uniref:Uncharacterized protein n=1 Tax=Streptomyces nymphaeiformis TaxID=2663842 RepID=A0A7W7U4X6_9ACTN|nr:hypothetical protein [Streptomyces nymphaeiformis]MBB4985163.1 hypothetical protein [Streptomyces nymphaeiformis]